VVEAHGGEIRHEPNGTRGARFSFALPPAGA
jgi:signal transduction histidine kinase